MVEILVPLGVCVVLPVLVVWLVTQKKKNETNRRAEILLAAIEKKPETDIREFLEQLNLQQNSQKKSLKMRLMDKLKVACVCTALGVGIFGTSLWRDVEGGALRDNLSFLYLSGIILLMVGIAHFIIYFMSKRMWRKELEKENYEA